MSSTGQGREQQRTEPGVLTPGPPPEPGGPVPGQARGAFREEALRRHAVRNRGPRVPVALRGPSFLMLWIAVAVLAAAGVVVAVLVAAQISAQISARSAVPTPVKTPMPVPGAAR
ncbi:hypothetical protein ACQPZZ_01205 [Microbispora sp. CA-135349]|uniref:hypothetical protein n=1 Tax=Microbispora sp. CA-135349 TaxID=3239953 RepID=UPI003D89DF70